MRTSTHITNINLQPHNHESFIIGLGAVVVGLGVVVSGLRVVVLWLRVSVLWCCGAVASIGFAAVVLWSRAWVL